MPETNTKIYNMIEQVFRDAQVNVDMDRAAEQMRESTLPTPPVPIFQSNKVVAILLGIAWTYTISYTPLPKLRIPY